jgi:hypothetical protein
MQFHYVEAYESLGFKGLNITLKQHFYGENEWDWNKI